LKEIFSNNKKVNKKKKHLLVLDYIHIFGSNLIITNEEDAFNPLLYYSIK